MEKLLCCLLGCHDRQIYCSIGNAVEIWIFVSDSHHFHLKNWRKNSSLHLGIFGGKSRLSKKKYPYWQLELLRVKRWQVDSASICHLKLELFLSVFLGSFLSEQVLFYPRKKDGQMLSKTVNISKWRWQIFCANFSGKNDANHSRIFISLRHFL